MGQASLTLIPPNEPTLFNYAALDRETEVAARSDAALIKGLIRRTAEDIVDIGSALNRQKDALGHGNFLPWIEYEFEMGEHTARRFMNVALVYGDGKSSILLDLKPSAVYELAAPSTPPEVRAEVERRIAAGELVDATTVRTLKATAQDLARVADQVREQNRDLEANAHHRAMERYGAENAALRSRIESMQAAAAASIDVVETTGTVIPFVLPQAGPNQPETTDEDDTTDITDATFGAHAIYTALSTIELAQTTPAAFWAIFDTPHLKPNAAGWLNAVIKKLTAIKKGMPK